MKRNSSPCHSSAVTTSLRVGESSRPLARKPRAHGGGFAAPTATEG